MENSLEAKTAAYLTHELRAPLTAVRCVLELLAAKYDGRLDEEDRGILGIALRNSGRLNLLIDDILDLAKVQSGRMRVVPVSCDPAALAREAVEDMSPWARKKGVELKLRLPEACPPVLAEARRALQTLINLLSNAIKFTPAGGEVELSLEPGRRDQAGYGVFSVRDTGCGIAPEDLGKVFRYFVQAGPPERRGEGTGLGLPLARAMVELQGGTMWVESELGKGTAFYFTLPVYLPVEKTRLPRREPELAS